jgi:uncharacterized protein (TIGR00255 family)
VAPADREVSMISSMTGYGQAERALSRDGHNVSCEIKTVNHRFCEVASKLPRALLPFEDKIRAMVKENLERGYITVKVSLDEYDDSLGALKIDYEYAKKYDRLLRKLKKELGLGGDIDVSLFIQRPGVIKETSEKAVSERDWRAVKSTIEKALAKVKAARRKEGSRLYSDMKKRAKRIGSIVEKVEKRSPETVEKKKKSLLKRIGELKDADYGRLRIEEEVAIFAQRSDVVEECVRLRSHLESLGASFKQERSVGRRIVFLLQEMNREANTIASKAQDAAISQQIVLVKEELERLREQAENIL